MEVVFDLIVSVVGVSIALTYVWAMRFHFNSPTPPPGAWAIVVTGTIGTLFLAWLPWLSEQPVAARLTGIAIEISGLALFFAAIAASRDAKLRAAFDPAHPHTLVERGPYAFVRHPFYLSYLLLWIGWVVAIWHPVAIVVLPVFISIYVMAARMEERNFAASPLAEDYSAYKRRAGFFWPRLVRWVSGTRAER